jgi:hypothetical protein
MASTLKKMTGMGGDVRKIAALLQKEAPAGHKLAYINDEEAALLKARGGSGKPHADTGIPSYEVEDTSYGGYDIQGGQDFAPPPEPITPSYNIGFGADQFAPPPVAAAPTGEALALSSFPTERPISPDAARLQAEGARILAAQPAAPTAPTTPKEEGMSKELLTRLGLAGGLGLIGASTARKAAAQGRAGAQQMQGLAAPYQKQGAELQAQAQRGELTPAAQQSLQAARAQATQSAEGRGGVGATQIEAQIQAFRQQLLAQQYDYGLKLSGIGDNIALGAIKSGLEADRYVNQLNNSFYTNMAYIASGSRPNVVISGGNT